MRDIGENTDIIIKARKEKRYGEGQKTNFNSCRDFDGYCFMCGMCEKERCGKK